MRAAGRNLVELPELNIAFFSFLLHFVWEMWQAPFFAEMASTAHASEVLVCSRATLGDAPRAGEVLIYLGIGLTLTVVFEWLATGPLDRWEYGSEMPRLPILGTGLLPALQWIMVPPWALWITARQLRSAETSQ